MTQKSTKEARDKLTTLISKLGWTRNQFARRWIWEKCDTDNEKEIKQFEETFKKQLSRDSTSASKIQGYTDFLLRQSEAKKLDYVMMQTSEIYDDILADEFSELSRKLDHITETRAQQDSGYNSD